MFAIVGICRNTVYASLQAPIEPTWYIPFQQSPDPRSTETTNFALRANSDPGLLANSVGTALHQIDPGLLIGDLRTQTPQIDNSIAFNRTFAELSMFFGVLALLLAAIGLYGILSLHVARRTRELGIRMALGAKRGRLLCSVLEQSLRWVIPGIVFGIAMAALSGRVVSSLLFGVQPLDWVSFLSAASLLVAVAVLAASLPARRAASIDPMQALRTE